MSPIVVTPATCFDDGLNLAYLVICQDKTQVFIIFAEV